MNRINNLFLQVDEDKKLSNLFASKKLGVAVNSVEVSRRERRSPRMSMISNDVRQSYRERTTPGTPDSRSRDGNEIFGK